MHNPGGAIAPNPKGQFPAQKLAQDGAKVWIIATKNAGGHDADGVQTVLGRAIDQHLGFIFGVVVGGIKLSLHPLERFVHHLTKGVAKHPDRAAINQPLHPSGLGCRQHLAGSFHVGLPHFFAVHQAQFHIGRRVKHPIRFGHPLGQGSGLLKIAFNDFNGQAGQARSIRPGPHQGHHPIAPFHQGPHQMRPGKSRCTGHEYPHDRPLLS